MTAAKTELRHVRDLLSTPGIDDNERAQVVELIRAAAKRRQAPPDVGEVKRLLGAGLSVVDRITVGE